DKLEMPDMPVRWNDTLIKYLEFYKDDPRGRNIMRGWLRAQGKYRELIISHLRRARLPEDLLYVAMIESSYDPSEYSRVGASGLWQFMPAGGRIYGLHIGRWLDERNDPVRSTEAAMLYWADLYQRFGDWSLAMAAYNGGYGAVLRAVVTFNSNNYWELCEYENALPWGTMLYVPKAMATAIVGRNREFFGFADVTPKAEVTWDTVAVPKSVSLATIARAAGVKVDDIRTLNPQLRRNRTPPQRKDYVVRVPAGRAELFAQRFPQLRGEWDRYDAFVVAHGQRFEDIATMHGIPRRRLATLNGVSHESEVRGGMVLVVPRVSADDKKRNLEKARANLYTSGSPKGKEGDKLLVAVPDKSIKVAGKRRVFYRVVTGDTQWDVAKVFAVSRAELAAWNGLRRDAHLHPRMILQVFVSKGFSAREAGVALLKPERLWVVTRGSEEHLNAVETRRGRKRITLRIDKRQSFETIGKKYGLTARDMARINRKPHDTVVEPGETVLVYKKVDSGSKAKGRSKGAKKKQPATRKARSAPAKKKSKGKSAGKK
ncbi:MAG: transglycosylase SLT domain-containing protein, partial [Myxococcota bacterium]